MKNISIKLKITIFNTLLMTAMVVLVLAFMMSISGSIIEFNSENIIKEVVEDNADELEYDDGKLDYDDVEFYENEVITLIYLEDGTLLEGNIRDIEKFTMPLEDLVLKHEIINGNDYFIYDKLVSFRKHSPVYVRGILSINAVSTTLNQIFMMALFALPIFIILASFGSYFISKKSFSPIEKIITTANDISHSDDLSLRINLENGKDEIHKLAKTFDEMFERLDNSFKIEKQFSSDVSHELRTPVAVILAECEYNMNEKNSENEKIEAFEVINRQALKMQTIIMNLLNLTRLDNGVNKAEFDTINLSELILIVCEEQQLLPAKNISLKYDIAENIYGEFDQSMMIRLVSNLISNAYNYGKINGFINVTLKENNEFIALVVKDDGIGIAKDEQEKIWHRFYQIDKSRTSKENTNMGLGLSMVLQIARIHNAKITLDSEVESGSTFTVEFPKS